MADVRARKVELDRRQARLTGQHLGHRHELVLVLAGDIGDHRRADRAKIGHVVLAKMSDSIVIQPDRVEQARSGLDGARSRIAGARLERDGLGDHAPQPLEADHPLHLTDVPERPRCDQHRILETQPSQRYLEVNHSRAPGSFQIVTSLGNSSSVLRGSPSIDFRYSDFAPTPQVLTKPEDFG